MFDPDFLTVLGILILLENFSCFLFHPTGSFSVSLGAKSIFEGMTLSAKNFWL